MSVHTTAIISPKAKIDNSALIGPYCIIDDNAVIGNNVKLWQNVYIGPHTTIGEGTEIHMGAVIGHVPQDLSYKPSVTYLKIGKNNIIREYANIHRAAKENASTVIGDNNFIMGYTHIAHDCIIGNSVIIGNGTIIAGHASIEDKAVVSGNCAVHQFARIGTLAMVGGITRVNKDIPPYMLCKNDSSIYSLNIVGIRRAGLPLESVKAVKEAFKILYLSGLNVSNALDELDKMGNIKEVRQIIDFIKQSTRGISSYIGNASQENNQG